ncbi:MAG: phenyltransferase domain-containing protein [Desulfobacterales bacterium]|nr:MAG: phenyltransferase domain-containing protein [Desulfobacterales bacterium]
MIHKKDVEQDFSCIASLADVIVRLQDSCGDIPWHEGGKTDPWDLVESAMGLAVAGQYSRANMAFQWLAAKQNSDGSWFSSYINGKPEDTTCQSHMACYLAVGLFHLYLITKDTEMLHTYWPCMEKGIGFALKLQTGSGEIYWARSPQGKVDPMCLLAASSSIFISLKCALSIAWILGKEKDSWKNALAALGESIRHNPQAYNLSKSRFSMYWFYPVLCGAVQGKQAEDRIRRHWATYVREGQGVCCVSDQPWITIAETCELILTLCAMGRRDKAAMVFSWIQSKVYEDNTFWCGYTLPDMKIWPEEKFSWTNAAGIMAMDALYEGTDASRLFSHWAWDGWRYKEL